MPHNLVQIFSRHLYCTTSEDEVNIRMFSVHVCRCLWTSQTSFNFHPVWLRHSLCKDDSLQEVIALCTSRRVDISFFRPGKIMYVSICSRPVQRCMYIVVNRLGTRCVRTLWVCIQDLCNIWKVDDLSFDYWQISKAMNPGFSRCLCHAVWILNVLIVETSAWSLAYFLLHCNLSLYLYQKEGDLCMSQHIQLDHALLDLTWLIQQSINLFEYANCKISWTPRQAPICIAHPEADA